MAVFSSAHVQYALILLPVYNLTSDSDSACQNPYKIWISRVKDDLGGFYGHFSSAHAQYALILLPVYNLTSDSDSACQNPYKIWISRPKYDLGRLLWPFLVPRMHSTP